MSILGYRVSVPVWCLLFLFGGTSCGLAQNQTDSILTVLNGQVESWNRGDIRGYMDGYWQSDSLLFTSGGTVRRGWHETLEKYQKSYSTPERMGTLMFSSIDVHPIDSDAAWIFGRWELRRPPDHPSGVFTLIMRRFTTGWKIIHDHTSVEPKERSNGKNDDN